MMSPWVMSRRVSSVELPGGFRLCGPGISCDHARVAEINPYAPPADDDGREPAPPKKRAKQRRAWREGDCVVMSKHDARLPKRCVVCNQRDPSDHMRKQFMWHPSWVYATIVAGWLIYFVL